MKLEGPPEKVWLQYHGDADPADYPADDYPDDSEVSWCWEPIFEHDIEYILLDKYKELEAERDKAFNAGLEAAAELVESDRQSAIKDHLNNYEIGNAALIWLEKIAAAIRALKEES